MRLTRLTRWFRVVDWASVVAPLRDAAREAPHRKPARPALWPELLEHRTLLSGLTPQPAPLVEPGGGSRAPAAREGQPAEAGPGPAPVQSTSQGDQGAGGLPHAGPDKQGGPADSGPAGDGGNGRQARSSGAVPGNEEAVGGLRGGGQERDQQGVRGAAFSSDQGAAGGDNRPAEVFGGGAAPGAPAPAEAAPVAAAPVEAAPVGLPANASSTDGAVALVGSDLGAQPSSADAVPNAGPSMGALPADTVDQALLPRASLLNAELSLGGGSSPLDFPQFLDGDGAFLELWDKDQLLFPDSLPKVDDIQFPGGLPWEREMPLPDRTPNLGGPLSLGEQPVEAPILASAVGEAAESAPAPPDGQEAVAAAALAAAPGGGLAPSSPDANRPEASPADAAGAPANRSDTDWGEDPLRPYKIALGLLPFLPAFGFTALTLRDRVRAGVRRWQELRGRRLRGV